MIRSLALLASLMLLAFSSAAQTSGSESEAIPNVNLTAGPTATQELFDEIARHDSALFDAAFKTCNADRLGELVTEDFEFYHDKHGLSATSGAQFVELFRGGCERQRQGIDFRARRELVQGSMAVYPLNNYGAIQVGIHRFYAIAKGKKDQLTETAKFTHVWKKEADGRWRISRALSYDHRLAE